MRYFWKSILQPHCEKEEWVMRRLLPKKQLYAPAPGGGTLAAAGTDRTGGGGKQDLFKVLEQDLVDHVRWEERDLFPYLQAEVQPDELEMTGKILEHRHTVHTDSFTPEFWIKAPKAK